MEMSIYKYTLGASGAEPWADAGQRKYKAGHAPLQSSNPVM